MNNNIERLISEIAELKGGMRYLIEKAGNLRNRLTSEKVYFTNLKLYEASYYAYEIGEKENKLDYYNSLFYDFCELSYEYDFKEMIESLDNWVYCEYIARTSTFYFTTNDLENVLFYDLLNANCNDKAFGAFLETVLFEASEYDPSELLSTKNFLAIYKSRYLHGKDFGEFSDPIEEKEMFLLEYRNELSDFIENFDPILSELERDISKVLKAYKWLETFKENQVESFKDYIESSEIL
ncbi:hypothetical protein EH802P2_00101 [Enterococcus phage EH802P2]|nr:hypothetical protein EH93P1_00096 [Enterococcus phage EH93P1]WAX15936.1 hypothetical protein EH93P2_00054 [Enterococcus phage EH93P2]WAX16206.1 hypothetical protein EH802P2_00101 [Enterococcus phage EH802P2]